MSNREYYIDLQMNKLTPEKQDILRKQVSNIDYSLFKALDHKGGDAARGEISPIGAVEVNDIAAREAEYRAIGLDAIRERRCR